VSALLATRATSVSNGVFAFCIIALEFFAIYRDADGYIAVRFFVLSGEIKEASALGLEGHMPGHSDFFLLRLSLVVPSTGSFSPFLLVLGIAITLLIRERLPDKNV
jgi:hypothetical protein